MRWVYLPAVLLLSALTGGCAVSTAAPAEELATTVEAVNPIDNLRFFLCAEAPEDGVYLYWLQDSDETFPGASGRYIFFQEGHGIHFDLPFTPWWDIGIACMDLDGDGSKELAITGNAGHGTGFDVDDLHVFTIGKANPFLSNDYFDYTDHVFSYEEVAAFINDRLICRQGERTLELTLEGTSITVPMEEGLPWPKFQEAHVGCYIGFSFDKEGILAYASVNTSFKTYYNPHIIADITARVTFDGTYFQIGDLAFKDLRDS